VKVNFRFALFLNTNMKAPPVLPEFVLIRVRRVGSIHGYSVLFVAGMFALLSAMAGDFFGAIVGLLVAGAGAIEHHGASLLGAGDSRGTVWLVSSQSVLFVTIAGYCFIRLRHVEIPAIPDEIRPMLEMNAEQAGMTLSQYLSFMYQFFFRLLLGLSILYQGGLGLYYFSKRHAIRRALPPTSQ